MEFGADVGVVDDVEVDDGEDVACCYGAGTDDGLGFVLEVVVIFFLEADGVVGEDVVEDVALTFWFATCSLLESAILAFDWL